MRENGKWIHIVEAGLAVAVLLLAAVMLRQKNGEEQKKVAVIMENSDGNHWAAFRYGLKMAAQDEGVELFIVSTGDTMTQEEEMEAIQQELDNGADAVIVQPVAGDSLGQELTKLEKKFPVMLVGSDLTIDPGTEALPCVQPDHAAMGRALAKEVLSDYRGDLFGKTVGIVRKADGIQAMDSRLAGVEKGLENTGASIDWIISGALKNEPKVDLVLALDDSSLIAVGECAAANDLHGALVYGIGNSTEAVYGLDTGTVECLIVPDTFSEGYWSLVQTAESIEHPSSKRNSRTVPYTVLRREKLFTKENQEILFTMSQ